MREREREREKEDECKRAGINEGDKGKQSS